jgi:LuxR family transcriptional regulator, quorum-sensing system regulator BjaR1
MSALSGAHKVRKAMPQCFAYGREALDFIHTLNHLASSDAVLTTLHHATARHGFETVLFLGLPARNQRFDDVVLGKHWPEEWTRIYSDGHYIHDDPIIRHLRRAVMPFEWREVTFDAERYPRAAELMQLRKDFGFGNAFVVPVPGAGGIRGGVSMGGARPELADWSKPAIHMMALYAFMTLSDMHTSRARAAPPLTEREREVLTWAAAGKSGWDISELLSIGRRTVYEHAQTATRKLGALNQTHAVALALQDGLISV